jgi:hypothetical protein
MSKKDKELVLNALDTIALKLRTWTNGERQLYERAVALLKGK